MAGLGRRSHYRKHLTDAVLNDLPEPDESIGQRIARVIGTRGGNMFDVVVAPLSSNKELADKEATNGARQSKDEEEILVSPSTTDENGSDKQLQSTETSEPPPIHIIQRAPQLAFLPTKFRKLVWIKRNDFVIVQCGEEENEEKRQQNADQKDSSSGGFRYVITNILYKDQVKHIKIKGLWPMDPFFADEESSSGAAGLKGDTETKSDGKDGDKGEKDELYQDNNDEQDGEAYDRDGTYEDNGIVFDDPLGDDLMVNTNRIATLRVEDSSSEEDSDGD
mmetsp:Transcript_3457/g.7610  ORF Transcript_3457/g.7610 Transcript_3457/m.7610 type:complete len:278 (-) Transcript_3457:1188-2021(-)|eukprot:CAMPEP_0172297670 /NCGR_PEP_ID=MMETSP1058-20130122/599_1 /TAXON_ID=83371 /ORGANISM="Detonula confervacea, Strain CCMP 353" /LENGTH=277 /DNA_ID=CAMNT_0013006845 /DNA_START=94 /DNA_END=927 /DNA_ORIENTATION=-